MFDYMKFNVWQMGDYDGKPNILQINMVLGPIAEVWRI
jgi:hypothetical protein